LYRFSVKGCFDGNGISSGAIIYYIRKVFEIMKTFALHGNEALHVNVKSFNILRAITDTDFFSRVELSPTARLVMFNMANMYNPKKGYVYPKNGKLMKCTGCGERAVSQAIGELKDKGIIVVALEQNFRKIYFTQKTYEQLRIIAESAETVEESVNFVENEPSPAQEKQKKDLGKEEFSVLRVAENAGAVAESVGGVAKNAGTCHEHKKEQIKKQEARVFDFSKNGTENFVRSWENKRDRYECEDLLRKESFLTNKVRSEIVLNGFHRFNIKGDDDFKAILRIKKVWDFKDEQFGILAFIEEKRRIDTVFARKIAKMENEVEFGFAGLEKEIQNLRTCWDTTE